MSVLKNRRITSKAEFVNTASEIYDDVIEFLTRLSTRYSRLMPERWRTMQKKPTAFFLQTHSGSTCA